MTNREIDQRALLIAKDAEIERLKAQVKELSEAYQKAIGPIQPADAEIERLKAVTDEILAIMAVYHEQENSSRGVGTPGGLEHMGDVWRLLSKWEAKLLQRAREATR